MSNPDSQRKITTKAKTTIVDGQSKYSVALAALETGVEEANRDVLLRVLGDSLPEDSVASKKPERNIALENLVALLLEMILSPLEAESEEATNLLKEGIKKRKDFRKAISQRGGILGRSASVISQAQSPSSTEQGAPQGPNPLNGVLNLIEVLQELAKSGVRQWDPNEAEELLVALQRPDDGEKEKPKAPQKKGKPQDDDDEDEEEEENEEDQLKFSKQNLRHALELKGLKKTGDDKTPQVIMIDSLLTQMEQLENEKEEVELKLSDISDQLKKTQQELKDETERFNEKIEREKDAAKEASRDKAKSESKLRELEEELKKKDDEILKLSESETKQIELRQKAQAQLKKVEEGAEVDKLRADKAEKVNAEIKAKNYESVALIKAEKEKKEQLQQDIEKIQKNLEEEVLSRQKKEDSIKSLKEDLERQKFERENEKKLLITQYESDKKRNIYSQGH
ncbi:MAG: hypothetical protein EZS28_013139 [Streblomastix strix]|uniref:Uncharacterized protein n=1 Tax=Streblomastix strix TaxID=222440 RepID=A0A5J4W8U4_9EUKA|nr:MAG: hypothetical protein EZS28_013139 [Streblomastix strix]